MSTPKSKHPPTWSPSDELRFADMTARRAAFYNHHDTELRKVILGMWPALGEPTKASALNVVVKNFQDNAERLRDALAPYDSGARPALNNASAEG